VITDDEVLRLRRLAREGESLVYARRVSGWSMATVRKWVVEEPTRMPSMTKPRDYRTRADPFDGYWPEIEALFKVDGLDVKTIFGQLQDRHRGKFEPGMLRTLQRRAKEWHALNGPEKEVFFQQVWRPGRQGQSDFTHMTELGITIRGELYEHLCYHFVLPWSNWEYVETAVSESFAALSRGLQNALHALGGAPEEHRTDNLSAATHNLKMEEGRAFNERYRRLVEHYGMSASKNSPGKGNENGDVEKGHDVFTHELDQQLLLRGSRDFESREDYAAYLRGVVAKLNERRKTKVEEERRTLKPLPATRLPDYQVLEVTVSRSSSTVRVLQNAYSVPATLVGHEVRVHVHAEKLEVFFGPKLVLEAERLRGEGGARINYRHVIGWLVRKPGAFKNYVYREELFPGLVFRRAYDALERANPATAGVEYLRILKLAAETMETSVAEELEKVLAQGAVPASEELRKVVNPRPPSRPEVNVSEPDLKKYDELYEEDAAA
jgi:transposase